MLKNSPLVSVVLPVYNAEKTLKFTIDSILTQKGNFELICVNDASTDASLEILKSYKHYSNFKIIDLDKNGGVSHARNIGLSVSDGEMVMFIDADDAFPSNLFEQIENLSLDNDLIIFNYKKVYKLSTLKPEVVISQGIKVSSEDCQSSLVGLKCNSKLNTRMTSVWGKIFKKSILTNNNIKFDENICIGEDSIFLYEFYEYSRKIVYYDLVGYYYYMNPLSVTHTFQPNMIENDKNWQNAFKKLIERLPYNSLSENYINYSIARGILNICYLNIAYKYSKLSFVEILNSIARLFEQKPYCEYNFDNLDSFYGKDKLILRLLKSKLYVIVSFVFYLNR